jgi:CBS domain-containing protein
MSLKSILTAKGDEVISIVPTADLAAAAELLTKRGIGVLVVRDADGRLVGMVSERDIVRAICENGIAAMQSPISQVMTKDVSTYDVNDSISSVMERMRKGKFRHMPVLDKGRLAGMVSIRDLLKLHLETIREHIHQIEASFAEFELMRL